MNIEIFLQSNLIPTLVISTCVWCGHWGALLIHQSHVWQHSVSIHCLQPIWTYHEVETLLVELGEVPGHSVQSNMLVLQTEPLPTFNLNFFELDTVQSPFLVCPPRKPLPPRCRASPSPLTSWSGSVVKQQNCESLWRTCWQRWRQPAGCASLPPPAGPGR